MDLNIVLQKGINTGLHQESAMRLPGCSAKVCEGPGTSKSMPKHNLQVWASKRLGWDLVWGVGTWPYGGDRCLQ